MSLATALPSLRPQRRSSPPSRDPTLRGAPWTPDGHCGPGLARVPGAFCGLWTATGSPRWLLSQSVSLSDVTHLRQEGWRFVMEAVTDEGDVSKKVQPFSVKDS